MEGSSSSFLPLQRLFPSSLLGQRRHCDTDPDSPTAVAFILLKRTPQERPRHLTQGGGDILYRSISTL